MTAEKHLTKALRIEESLKRLLPDDKGENVAAVVELAYGIIQHLLAYGCEKRFKEHLKYPRGFNKIFGDEKGIRDGRAFPQPGRIPGWTLVWRARKWRNCQSLS